MDRLRLGVLLALAVALGLFSRAPKAGAAAEVHRFNLVISAVPSQINGNGINDLINRFNQYPLQFFGNQPIDKITYGWLFDAELQYFIRPNFAVTAGVGQIKSATKQEYLPTIGSDINIRSEVLTVPVHLGGIYYFAPYNQGDFQARAYVGGGLLSLVGTHALFQQNEVGTDSSNTLGGNQMLTANGNSPGLYAEVGAHMFFASRYSVMVGAIYRSARVENLVDQGTLLVPTDRTKPNVHLVPLLAPDGQPFRVRSVDVGGVGVKMALGIGF